MWHDPGVRAAIQRALSIALSLISAGVSCADTIPGVLRQHGSTFLVENNSGTYLTLHAAGLRGVTVVHLDTHDDCRYVAPQKVREAAAMCAAGEFDAVHRASDLDPFFRMEVRAEDQLFDLGNFLYPCIVDGTVSRLYWVVPNLTLDDASATRLRRHLSVAFRVDDLAELERHPDTGFSFTLHRARVTVTTLDALPALAPGAVIDLDTDFFAFPRAMTDDHLTGALQWDPEKVCEMLKKRVPEPAQVVVCASVWGGYLPLPLRFIPDACFDAFARGKYPADARSLLHAVIDVRTGAGTWDALRPTETPSLSSAYEYLSALAALERGDSTRFTNGVLSAATSTPVYGKGLLDAADAMADRGEAADASPLIDAYETAVGQATVNSLSTRAKVLAALGDYSGAEAHARRVLAWSRSNYRMVLLAGILVRDGRASDALPLYREALVQAPEDAALHYNTGVAYGHTGNLEQAMQHYERAVAIETHFFDAWHNLAGLRLDLGKSASAVSAYQTAIRLKPDSAATHFGLGLALHRTGDFGAATQQLHRATALSVSASGAHAALGTVHFEQGDLARAKEHWVRAVQIEPRDAKSHYELGNLALRLTNLNVAVLHYVDALEAEPTFAEAHGNLALAFLLADRPQEAVRHADAAARLAPDSARAHLHHARALFMLRQRAEAAAAAERARALNPQLPELPEFLRALREQDP